MSTQVLVACRDRNMPPWSTLLDQGWGRYVDMSAKNETSMLQMCMLTSSCLMHASLCGAKCMHDVSLLFMKWLKVQPWPPSASTACVHHELSSLSASFCLLRR